MLRRGGLGLEAPGAGHEVSIEGIGADGGVELSISFDGQEYSTEGASLVGATAGSSPADCSDATKGAPTDRKARAVLNWALRSATVPASVGSNALSAISTGRSTIVNHTNNCGEVRDPNAPIHSYVGGTASSGAYSADFRTCPGSSDGINVVEWGNTGDTGFLGLVCTWKDTSGGIVGFDMRFQSTVGWLHTRAGCADQWIVQSVAAHEWGHVYGLSHVDEATHGNLTMSSKINGTCQDTETTLGVGDMAHMFDKYGFV